MERVKLIWLTLIFVSVSLFVNKTYAQNNWSPQQKEVWTNVQTYWSLLAKGDADGFMTYFSDSYMGWEYDTPVPQDKATTAKYVTNAVKNGKTDFYDLTPVAIMIYGDIAIVDYYYNQQVENMEGKKTWRHGRWTDILQKQAGGLNKWVLIADHGGEEPSKD